MRDKIGKIPTIKTKQEALQEILKITKDKRSHILLQDCVDWLELKMKVIKVLAQRGLKAK